MLVIALTGGIGSGKSTVADELAARGAGVIDTDLLARELTEPGQPALGEIAATFGPRIIDYDGRLDRDVLRGLVFADPQARRKLEAILHPRIKDLMLERLAALDAPYAVLVIPLLFETNQDVLADRVLVVDLPEPVQLERVRRRSGLPTAEIERIIASQISRNERLARADDIIDNAGDHPALLAEVERLHQRYLQLAAAGGHRTTPP
jgi:dephospho-CoA kinase